MERIDEIPWLQQLKDKPFAKVHFTEELMDRVHLRTKKGPSKRHRMLLVSSMAVILVILAAGISWIQYGSISEPVELRATDSADPWKPTGYFTVNGKRLLGHEGKVGLLKMNADSEEEPFLSTSKGAHFQIFFWGKPDQFQGKYKMTAVRKNGMEVIPLYEYPFQTVGTELGADAMSAGKIALGLPGIYRFEIFLNDIYFDELIVEVDKAGETGLIVNNPASIPENEVTKLVEVTQKHFQFANADDFDRYGDTMNPKPDKVEDGTPVFTVWKDARVRKQELMKIMFVTADDVGRPRVIANVDWTDRGMMVAFQKFGNEWKIVSLD